MLRYTNVSKEHVLTAKELYLYALDQASHIVGQVGPEQLSLPTPDIEWDVHALLAHMLYELAWAADIVSGKTVAEVGTAYDGDLLGADVGLSWRRYELATRQSVRSAHDDMITHLSYGDKPVDAYLIEAGNDLLVHAWDLGQAIDEPVIFDPIAARYLYDEALRRQDELAQSGLFAPAVDVPESADLQTKLLALLGRSEKWRSAERK